MAPYVVDAVAAVTVMHVLWFVLHVLWFVLRECEGVRVTAMLACGTREVWLR